MGVARTFTSFSMTDASAKTNAYSLRSGVKSTF